MCIWPDRRILHLFDIELPIIQAPMAGPGTPELAIAVSDAGGLGSLPCAQLSLEQTRVALQRIGPRTSRRLNLNFFCHTPPAIDAVRSASWHARLAPYYVELGLDPETAVPAGGRQPFDGEFCELVEEYRPAVVSFHFGLPERGLLERVKATGATVISSATTVDEARWLEEHGCDAVIAMGLEAGGHRGNFLAQDMSRQVGTFALVPQVADAVRVPVIAAGGIADATGVAAALSLGAALVQVGTAFLLCPEATISVVHREALASEASRHTALTRIFTGRPARSIVNRLMREQEAAGLAPAFPLATAAIAPLRKAAEARGSGDFSPLWSGQNASGCRAVSAAELTRGLFQA